LAKYRKKPVVIEAVRWSGDNTTEIMLFVGSKLKVSTPPHGMELDTIVPNDGYSIVIPTLEGDMTAIRNDYIIKGVKGEFYPCKPDIFLMTYDEVEGGQPND
jgi:hypothetical protein